MDFVNNKIITTALLLCMLLANQSFAQKKPSMQPHVGFSPARFNVSLDSGTVNETINVINLTDKAQRLVVEVGPWTLDESSKVVDLEPSKTSLDQWMIINPTDATIKPKETRSIRWAILPKLKPVDGEHRVMVYLTEISEKGEQESGISLTYRFGIPIYVNVGDIKRIGVLNNVKKNIDKPKTPAIGLDISSNGNAYVRIDGGYGVWEKSVWPGEESALDALIDAEGIVNPQYANNSVLAGIPDRPVLPGHTRTIWFQPLIPELDAKLYKKGSKVDLMIMLSFSLGETEYKRAVPLSVVM
ncbi:MAG: hypothetical protein ACI90U_002255 [Pseudomonadales bacterium]|jgi:hypothetical protein